MKTYSIMEMEEILRDIVNQKVKSFDIEYFAEQLELDLADAAKLLYDFSEQSTKLIIKYEIRCDECIEFISEFDNIEDIEIGMTIECEHCPKEVLTIDEDNIYIKYHISEEFIKCISSHTKLKGLRKKGKMRSTPSNLYDLKEEKAIGVVNINANHITLEYTGKKLLNYGTTGTMGDNSTSSHNTFEK